MLGRAGVPTEQVCWELSLRAVSQACAWNTSPLLPEQSSTEWGNLRRENLRQEKSKVKVSGGHTASEPCCVAELLPSLRLFARLERQYSSRHLHAVFPLVRVSALVSYKNTGQT